MTSQIPSSPPDTIYIGAEEHTGTDESIIHWMLKEIASSINGVVLPLDENAKKLAERCQNHSISIQEHPISVISANLRDGAPYLKGVFDTVITFHLFDFTLLKSILDNMAWLLNTGGQFIALTHGMTGLYKELSQGIMYWSDQNVQALRKTLGRQFRFYQGGCFLVRPADFIDEAVKCEQAILPRRNTDLMPIFTHNKNIVLPSGLYIWFAAQKREGLLKKSRLPD